MQGRMLRWIKNFYEAKQLESETSKRAEKHKEMMEVIREIREGKDEYGKYLDQIRGEVAAIENDAEKMKHFLYVDDLISFAIILKIIDELRALYQAKTTNKYSIKSADYKFETDASIKQFDAFLDANNIDTITRESVDDFIRNQRRGITAHLASSYGFNNDEISEAFKYDLESDIALSYISHIFKQSDMRQTAGMLAMTKEFLWLKTSKILNPYISMPHLAACLELHAETVALYHELNVWMKGVHYYHASLLKRELNKKQIEYIEAGDGVILMKDDEPYPPMNSIVDSAMKHRFGLTFYDLARYVHDCSQMLTSRLLAVKTEKDADLVTDKPESSVGALQQSGLFASSSAAAAAAVANDEEEGLQPQIKPA